MQVQQSKFSEVNSSNQFEPVRNDSKRFVPIYRDIRVEFLLSKEGNFYFFPFNRANNKLFFLFFANDETRKKTSEHLCIRHHSSSTRLILPLKDGGKKKKFATSRNNYKFMIYPFILIHEIFCITWFELIELLYFEREKSNRFWK